LIPQTASRFTIEKRQRRIANPAETHSPVASTIELDGFVDAR
jgi:hypothetical protein